MVSFFLKYRWMGSMHVWTGRKAELRKRDVQRRRYLRSPHWTGWGSWERNSPHCRASRCWKLCCARSPAGGTAETWRSWRQRGSSPTQAPAQGSQLASTARGTERACSSRKYASLQSVTSHIYYSILHCRCSNTQLVFIAICKQIFKKNLTDIEKKKLWKITFLFRVITKHWLCSPCCTTHSWAYVTPRSVQLPLPFPSSSPPPCLVPHFILYICRYTSIKGCSAVLSRVSHVWLCVTLWTVARQAPLSMGFSRARTLEWVAMPSSHGVFSTQGLNSHLPIKKKSIASDMGDNDMGDK